jgi:hypothetical protein
VELHLDAAQAVGPEVLAFGADDKGGLHADARLGLRRRGAQRLGHRVRGEVDFDAPALRAQRGASFTWLAWATSSMRKLVSSTRYSALAFWRGWPCR